MSDNALPQSGAKSSANKLIEQAKQRNDRAAMISQLAKDAIREQRYLSGELSRK